MPKPGSKAWKKRVADLTREELNTTEHWFYCSFATDGRGFLGGLFIKGHGVVDITSKSHRLQINPGGQMVAIDLGENPRKLPATEYLNRLLTREELEEASGPVTRLGDAKKAST